MIRTPMIRNRSIVAVILAFAATLSAHAADAPKYHILRHMALGGDGGWDYQIGRAHV